jgi:hypothetical protein
MTKQKHLKARVRARMSKTGESYASARRHLVIGSSERTTSQGGYALRGGSHPDTAAIANVLANYGVISGHSGRPLSEALILGVGGGLGAGYILWQFRGHHPIVTLGFRKQWQYPDRWLEKTCDRLGIPLTLDHTSGSVGAARSLEQSLAAAGPPPVVWIDAQEVGYWHLPSHLSGHGGYPVVVYKRAEGRFLIDDRNSAPLSVDEETMRSARGRVSSYRNRLARLEPPPSISPDRLVDAVKKGLADQVEHLSSPSDSFSLPAWRKWSRMLVDTRNRKGWPNAFADQIGLFGALLSMYESIESAGYNGGSLRDLFAMFLDEAADLLSLRALSAIAEQCRGLDREWTRLAETAAPPNLEPFATARQLIDSLHEHVLEEGDEGREAAEAAATDLWQLRMDMKEKPVFESERFHDVLGELSTTVDTIYRMEQDLVTQLSAALGGIKG